MPSYNYSVYKTSNNRHRGSAHSRGTNKRHGQYIDPARFVRKAQPVAPLDAYVPQNTFADFAVADVLKANLANKHFVTPTPIQDQAIPPALTGKDIIGIANTGTGKTAAFALPVLNKLINDPRSRALIIAPTRELAQQIEAECGTLARGTNLRDALLIGGAGMGLQLRDLRSNPQVVIGTPGRIKDHIERGTLRLSNFNMVVLDEVDRMLDMGFVHDVTTILSHVAPERQSFFFSATLDGQVRTLIQTFSKDPVIISLKVGGETSENINQDVVRYNQSSEKLEKLHDILNRAEVSKTIVFDDTQRGVERLSRELVARGFQADSIHGGKTQGQRQRALERFKQNQIKVLVATDVAARGIDVADISHVINYSQPQSYEDYIHRIGRAGRAGKVGNALTFVGR